MQVWKENHVLVRILEGEGSSRTLTVTFLDADGLPVGLTGCTPRLYLVGSNPPVFLDGTVKDAVGGTAVFVLPSGFAESRGVFSCQFLLTGADYPPLKADGLTLLVEASDLESAEEATEEYSALVNALKTADTVGQKADAAAAEAKAASEAAAAHAARSDNPHAVTAAQAGAVPVSAKGAAGGVMALPSALPAAGSLLTMAAGGTVSGGIIPISCVLRATSSGWTLLNNSGHVPLNVQNVSISSGEDTLTLDHAVGASKVLSFQITPDEQFAKYGVSAGASVGLDYSLISLFMHVSASGWAVYNSSSASWTLQSAYSNLCTSVAWSDAYGGLMFIFDDSLKCANGTDFSAHFLGKDASKLGYRIQVRNPDKCIVVVFVYDASGALVTTPSVYTNLLCRYDISNSITPANLVTYPIANSDFFVTGFFLK